MIDPDALINPIPSEKRAAALAVVTTIDDAGLTLRFEGDTEAGQKKYQQIQSYDNVEVGQRVIVLAISGTWLVLGAIGEPSAEVAGIAPGTISLFGGATAPSGSLFCDGASYVRTEYQALFDAIGTTYGAADSTHFNVPNLKGRVPVGRDAAQTEFDVLGETGGAKTHTLSVAQMPSHAHLLYNNPSGGDVFPAWTSKDTGATSGPTQVNGVGSTTTPTGGGQAHPILQPYIVLNYIIKT